MILREENVSAFLEATSICTINNPKHHGTDALVFGRKNQAPPTPLGKQIMFFRHLHIVQKATTYCYLDNFASEPCATSD